MKQQPMKQKTGLSNFIYQRARLRPGPMASENAQSPQVQHYRDIGNQAVQRMLEARAIQAKLKIGQPNDQYEQEADSVANRVMKMEDGALAPASSPSLKRQEEKPEEEEVEKPVLTKAAHGSTPEVSPGIESSINAMKGGGQPLSESTRSFFEPRFGADFSQVRIHTDSRAVQTAQAIDAKAFTTGKDIVFNSGQYSPNTTPGKHLLAHELTHVVQQTVCNDRHSLKKVQIEPLSDKGFNKTTHIVSRYDQNDSQDKSNDKPVFDLSHLKLYLTNVEQIKNIVEELIPIEVDLEPHNKLIIDLMKTIAPIAGGYGSATTLIYRFWKYLKDGTGSDHGYLYQAPKTVKKCYVFAYIHLKKSYSAESEVMKKAWKMTAEDYFWRMVKLEYLINARKSTGNWKEEFKKLEEVVCTEIKNNWTYGKKYGWK